MILYNPVFESKYNDWQEIDLIVSRDCTLRCTYCYLHKSEDREYKIDAMMDSLDILLSETENNSFRPGVILGLFPEPWVNIPRSNDLIIRILDKVSKYKKLTDHFMLMLGTNGVRLDQEIPILNDYLDRASIQVTIDGIKDQHDLYRRFADGSPSWDIVKSNILKYQKKYLIYTTKVTLGPDTLKYLYESSVFLWEEMNIKDIHMNVVFENLWGDENQQKKCLDIFEQQLDLLTSDIIKNRRWEKDQYQSIVGSRVLSPKVSNPPTGPHPLELVRTYCGAGVMRSIDSDGRIYPCFRLSPYGLSEDSVFNLSGNQKYPEVVRSLSMLNNFDSVPEKCRQCELLSNCAMCVGGAYTEFKSIYNRTIHHCEFVKLQSKYAQKVHEAMN